MLIFLLALAQNVCPEPMAPIVSGQADKSYNISCPWKASGCDRYKLVWKEIQSPDIDQVQRVALNLVCVLDRPEPPPEPSCPTSGPAQALQDSNTEDLILSCAAVPEGCPPFLLVIDQAVKWEAPAKARCTRTVPTP